MVYLLIILVKKKKGMTQTASTEILEMSHDPSLQVPRK